MQQTAIERLVESYANRFWSQVQKTEDCWIWTGCVTSRGYGAVTIARRIYGAHRVAYELEVGPLPDGMIIRHRCDNPLCVRPDHLEVGTHADNMRDMVERGRQRWTAESRQRLSLAMVGNRNGRYGRAGRLAE